VATPPTTDEVLKLLQLVTPADYHEPFINDTTGAIAQYRGWARAKAELAAVISRSASRQLFLAGPDSESAGFSVRATMLVTLERTEDLDRLLIADEGTITIGGPRGRVYRSAAALTWFPFDPTGEQELEFVCDQIGEYGNLDWLADADGNLTDPVTDGPLTSVVDLQRLSQGRAGVRGRLEIGSPSKLVAQGLAPTFGPPDVGLYVRINYAGDTDNIGRVLRIVGYEVDDADDPAQIYPRSVLLDDTPQPALVTAAILDDGGVLTDYTDEARSRTSDDLPLLPAVPVVGDAIYFLYHSPFTTIRLSITDERIGDLELTWEYWDGVTWTAIAPAAVSDESNGFSAVGTFNVTISGALTGWSSTTVDTREGYPIRARVSAFTSQTNQPLAALALVLVENPLVADPLDSNGDGQISWAILDWRDLGVSIVSMAAPEDGREGDLELKLRERQVVRRDGESETMLRRRASRFPDVVTPEMLEWEINRILEPLGLAGQIAELNDGYQGLFWDVPASAAPFVVGAWDLYEPGAAHPEDATFLPLSEADIRWHFWVIVPEPTLGEFGAAWDAGPPSMYVETFGGFIGSAWDYAFTDGYAATSAAIYKQVYDAVEPAKAGGISFDMIVGDVPVCP
jgi:hypothetical protein